MRRPPEDSFYTVGTQVGTSRTQNGPVGLKLELSFQSLIYKNSTYFPWADIQSYQLTRNFGPKPEFGPNSQNDPKKARILAFWPDF